MVRCVVDEMIAGRVVSVSGGIAVVRMGDGHEEHVPVADLSVVREAKS